jgi:hypothetical protein
MKNLQEDEKSHHVGASSKQSSGQSLNDLASIRHFLELLFHLKWHEMGTPARPVATLEIRKTLKIY